MVNRAENGGGLYLDDIATAYVVNALLTQNHALANGGAISSIGGALLYLNASILSRNSAGGSGGAAFVSGGGAFIGEL